MLDSSNLVNNLEFVIANSSMLFSTRTATFRSRVAFWTLSLLLTPSSISDTNSFRALLLSPSRPTSFLSIAFRPLIVPYYQAPRLKPHPRDTHSTPAHPLYPDLCQPVCPAR